MCLLKDHSVHKEDSLDLLPVHFFLILAICPITRGCVSSQELHDYGGGIPNELVVMLERCVGLNARWPGILPDAYLTYRLYDLPPHVSQTAQCTADPVFNDTTSYPLAVTADVLHYLRYDCLEAFFMIWVF